jgi:serpin B
MTCRRWLTTPSTLGFCLALGVAACGGESRSVPGVAIAKSTLSRNSPPATALPAAVLANNAFAFDLYGKLAAAAGTDNLVLSPLSAWLALGMTYAGARGQTAAEMASVLHFGEVAGSPFDAQNALSLALAGRAAAALAQDKANTSTTAPSPTDYQLQVVNSVWGEKTYNWASSFLDVLAASYGTGVYREDFINNPFAARETINEWVSTQTSDKIRDLLPADAIKPLTRIVLVNAIHLKLPWERPFSPSETAPGAFIRGDGTAVTASFMHGSFEADYVETTSARAVWLPLAGGDLSVMLILPKTSLATVLDSLGPSAWAAMGGASELAEVALSLPKFAFTTPSFSLGSALEALGMTSAFSGTANFEGLCAGGGIVLSDVLQKAMMAVTETGVEAAAATAVLGEATSAPVHVATLTFDHPFIVSIVDSSGAILFLAQIDDPSAVSNP